MEVLSTGPLRAASVLWLPTHGGAMLTVVCKATYVLLPGESDLAPEQEYINEDDNHWNDDPARSLYSPSDLVPFKTRGDVMVVGHAFAPRGEPVRSVVVRLIVGEIDKSIEVFGERSFTQDGQLRELARFSKMPLRYERAAGGPETSNPVGLRGDRRADVYGNIHVPNLQPPGLHIERASDLFDPIGFGPIAPSWPTRREKLGRHAAGWSESTWNNKPLPEDIDPSFFNAAPRDQQVRELRENERIVLENLHPEHSRLVTSLPGVRPQAFLARPGVAAKEVALKCDTLWIDTDRSICTLTWRGQIKLESAAQPGRILVATAPPGKRLSWAEIDLTGLTSGAAEAPNDRTIEAFVDSEPDADDTSVLGPPMGGALPFVSAPQRSSDADLSALSRTSSEASTARPRPMGGEEHEPAGAAVGANVRDASPPWLHHYAAGTGALPAPGAPTAARMQAPAHPQQPPAAPRTATPPPIAAPPLITTAPPLITASPRIAAPPTIAAPPPVTFPSATPASPAAPPRIESPWAAAAPSHATEAASSPIPPPRKSSPANVGHIPGGTAPAMAPSHTATDTAHISSAALSTQTGSPGGAGAAGGAPAGAALTGAGGASAVPGGAVAASNAAAAAAAWSVGNPSPGSAPSPAAPAPVVRSTARPQGRRVVDLLWFDATYMDRIRADSKWKALIASLKPKTTDADDDPFEDASAAPLEKEKEADERRDVFGVLTRADATDLEGVNEAIADGVSDDGTFVRPLLVLMGDLTFPFDELETLKATVTAVTPLMAGDKRLKDTVDTVNELLKTPWLQSGTGVAEGLTAKVKEAFAQGNRMLPASYLDTHTERILLEQRHYQKRTVFGEPWIRSLLLPAGSSQSIPAYLPESLSKRLPMFQTMRVRIIAEAHLQQDQYETHPSALRVIALGRVAVLSTRAR